MPPTTTHHPLHRADGSATHTTPLHTILAAASGPLEVQRRDELPAESYIDVHVRPASGVGGPRERWLEGVLANVLRDIVLVHLHPRTVVLVTLQVVAETGEGRGMGKGRGEVTALPALLNAAFAALVDAGVPLGKTVVAGLAGVGSDGGVVAGEMGEKEVRGCRSLHAMAFTMGREMVLDQSAGRFTLAQWEEVAGVLERECAGAMAAKGEDESMVGSGEDEPWLRLALEEMLRRLVRGGSRVE